jgi:hypothetical protein
MKRRVGSRNNAPAVLGKFALVILGLMVALGMAELLLRAYPDLVPGEVRVNPPVRRKNAHVDESFDVKLSDGDLFHWMQGALAPVPPAKDRVVAKVHMVTDADGFRNAAPASTTYGIVALGDSFTRATGVPSPWPQKLAETTGLEVFSLGDIGFGPQDELEVLRQYGLEKRPQWVIMAYFGGNDLYDAAAYEQANPFLLTRFVKFVLEQSVDALNKNGESKTPAAVASTYRYPITVAVNGTRLEMAFFSSYVSWLSASGDVIEESKNYQLVRETLLTVQGLSEDKGSRFLLVYAPSKAHVYLPYVDDDETLERIFANVPTIELDGAGYLQFAAQKATAELTFQHMDDQARLLAAFAADNGIDFLNLTPHFQEQAAAGAELYYAYDTHWNQDGHDLAAQAINDYIKSNPVMGSSNQSGTPVP